MSDLTGTLGLLRAALRRDRWLVLWWTLGLVALYWSTAVALPTTYDTQEALDAAASAIEGNAAYVAMSGPTRALDTIGGQVAWQTQVFGGVIIGLMAMFVVIRHTRAEEDNGRDELLRSVPVGRLAPAASGIAISLLISLVAGVLAGLAVASTGLELADSMAMGLGLAGCGFAFTGISWVAAQVASTARSAYGLAGTAIGVAYALRAVGDVSVDALSWLTPIGWYSQMHAFSGLRWWPLLLMLALAVATLVLAARLIAVRDYGSGLRAARPGSAEGAMGSAGALAARLHRGPIIGWAVGMLLGGVAYGAIGNDAQDMMGDSAAMMEMLGMTGQDILDGFYGTAIVMLAAIAGGYTISSAMRPRREEEAFRTETLLATRLSRGRWLLSHIAATVIGTLVVLVCAALGLALGYWGTTGETDYAWALFWPMAQYVPAVLLLSAIARVVFGLAPKLMGLAWLPLVFVVVVLFFGELLRFPDWVMDLSPFTHLPLLPAESFAWTPVLVTGGIVVVLSAVGQVAFRRRDVG